MHSIARRLAIAGCTRPEPIRRLLADPNTTRTDSGLERALAGGAAGDVAAGAGGGMTYADACSGRASCGRPAGLEGVGRLLRGAGVRSRLRMAAGSYSSVIAAVFRGRGSARWTARSWWRCRPARDHVEAVSWSPDGEWIAVLGAPGGETTRTRVWVVRPDGRGARRVAGVRSGTASFGPWLRSRRGAPALDQRPASRRDLLDAARRPHRRAPPARLRRPVHRPGRAPRWRRPRWCGSAGAAGARCSQVSLRGRQGARRCSRPARRKASRIRGASCPTAGCWCVATCAATGMP